MWSSSVELVCGRGREIPPHLLLKGFMKRRNRDHTSLSGFLDPGREKGPFFLRTHEEVPSSAPGRPQRPTLMMRTLPVSKRVRLLIRRRENAFSASIWPSVIRRTESAPCTSSTVLARSRSSLA